MTVGYLLVIAAALVVRTAGASLRFPTQGMVLRLVGWVASALAGWLAAAAAGAWSPWWPALTVGIVGCLAEELWVNGSLQATSGRRLSVRALADLAVVVLTGLISLPLLSLSTIALTVFLVVVIGLGIDRLVGPFPARLLALTGLALTLALLLVGLTMPALGAALWSFATELQSR